MPRTYRSGCLLGGTLDSLFIWNYNYTGELCFDGTGYLPVAIYDVNSVTSYSVYDEWIRYYNPSGHYCTLVGNIFPLQSYIVNFGDPSSVKITQIDVDGRNGPNC